MEEYMPKSTVVAEIEDLYEDIDKCIGDLVLAKSKHDQRGVSDTHWKMETLMVNTQQVLSYILRHLEVKEVDFINEFHTFSEKHKLMDKDIEFSDIEKTASFFFQLGIKAKEEKRKYIGHVGGTFTTTTK